MVVPVADSSHRRTDFLAYPVLAVDEERLAGVGQRRKVGEELNPGSVSEGTGCDADLDGTPCSLLQVRPYILQWLYKEMGKHTKCIIQIISVCSNTQ